MSQKQLNKIKKEIKVTSQSQVIFPWHNVNNL